MTIISVDVFEIGDVLGTGQPESIVAHTHPISEVTDLTSRLSSLDATALLVLPQYSTREDFVAAVSSGLTSANGNVTVANGLTYQWQSGATAISDLPGLVPVAPYHADHWGVTRFTNNGSNAGISGDNTSKLQEAHDYVASIGGGEIDLGSGVIPFATTLYFGEGSPVLLRGVGRGEIKSGIEAFRQTAGTRLLWTGTTGTGVMLTADRNDTGLNFGRSGGGLVDVMLDGNMQSATGMLVKSHGDHDIKITTCYWGGAFHFGSTCLANGLNGSPADNQRFRWSINAFDTNTSNEPEALVVINGTGTANTSIGVIEELNLVAEQTAVAAHFGDMDGIIIKSLMCGTRTSATGDGGKVFLHASDTLPVAVGTAAGSCRYITFAHVQATGGIVAKQRTATGNHSGPNHILELSRGNGSPLPTVESNALLYWVDSDGAAVLAGISGDAVQSSVTDATAGRALVMNVNDGPFGLGALNSNTSLADLDEQSTRTGWYRVTNTASGTYPGGLADFGIIRVEHYDSNDLRQFWHSATNNAMWTRRCAAGVWGAWTIMQQVVATTTAARPTTQLVAGLMVYDTTLNKPIWRNAANDGWVDAMEAGLSSGAPVTKTADFTVAETEQVLINNKAGSTCTVTLPAAASYTGRLLTLLNYQAQTVVSASSNVVPRASGAAGTAILAAAAGAWADLVSDGTNWIIVRGS
jgi:hypothetical protein